MRSRFCSIASPVRVSDMDEGSIEYCIVKVAQSPRVMYSRDSAMT